MTEQVLLLHGLWMRSLAMRPLASRLRAAGFAVHTIDYFGVFRGPEPCIAQVAGRLRRDADGIVHLVGHSLGGLIAVRAALAAGDAFRGRILCLGTPLAGSATARSVIARRGVGAIIGRSSDLLAKGIEALPVGREVGVIAGRHSLGFGRLAHRFHEPNDGSVSLAETRVPGLTAHVDVAVSHTGLLFSPEVAQLAVRFLREGRFADAGPAA